MTRHELTERLERLEQKLLKADPEDPLMLYEIQLLLLQLLREWGSAK